MIEFIHRKIINPILVLLKQGVTPEKISLSIALGGTFGVFPVIGSTSILCGIMGVSLRLNMIAIQVVNYSVYPLQLLLLVPFVRLGEYMLGSDPFPISPTAILEMLRLGLMETIRYFWYATMHGILGWSIISIPVAIIIYFMFLPILRKTAEQYHNLKKNEQGI